jgi:hypothetical protein
VADEVPASLCDGRFDAASALEAHPAPGLCCESWRREHIDLLVAENHPFALQPIVAIAHLEATAMVIPERMTIVGGAGSGGDVCRNWPR